MADYAKLRVQELKELLKARQLPVDGSKATLVQRLSQSDARAISIEEVVTRRVKLEMASLPPLSQTRNAMDTANTRTVQDVMDTLNSIPVPP
ncbi:hypothetical protein DSL72_008028 [Monilinia vaccinii-corymbosi]|uniref:SAP domain-containing protein n=1 Tax=Monilinia vaccinii-corymbosi TaxID=61207 RepID=A0A8A3PJL0_9HELO|nr:hypothetical protein DSL72_008028 [Monilinia vaccinii-corymbosi]